MNTVDPAQARRDRLDARRGSTGMLVAVVAASVVTVVAAFVAGLGFGQLVEMFRSMAVDSVFDDRGDERPPFLLMWGMFGFVGALFAGGTAATAARNYLGRPTRPLFPLVLALAAHTAGTWVSSRDWLPPLAVGTAVDPVFHKDEAWGPFGWLMYYADWWLPVGMLLLTATALLLTVRHARTQAALVAERDRLLRHGYRVSADVVEVKARVSSDEGGTRTVGSTVTVAFVDRAGVRHWATRYTSDVGVPTGPNLAQVLYDPEHPTRDQSIFVSVRRLPALSDWLPAADSGR
ncbi:DUF3592 domain-containing protein [Actinosynnema sp. NPDC047251]|uniref:Putative secreted protein n=1 Tax=Saccharothrix espanaensis (strain ATCC 51144 / DSM 44229 / JCM 9112 / NBRC 15066 / NRRL 15764) TaxID=1179773 RepID=K0JQK3_SACES|nr:DUF3592 domain-containing protein [Saccharothrix espanaensis]CCH29650.1 putative secreted protein [Saccharothrix espanaensis DSM 44229]